VIVYFNIVQCMWILFFPTVLPLSVTPDHPVNEHWDFNINLTSVRQYIIDNIDELRYELSMIDDECRNEIIRFVAIAGNQWISLM